MRIIERTNLVNKVVLYIVQEENKNFGGYNQLTGYLTNQLPRFNDVRSFASLQEARDFMYQYTHNLSPGERVVT